ncbi:hypothetical protein [Caudoviricetes sp.]|nr:hypothetical protein [Caudoviricetes sp.]
MALVSRHPWYSIHLVHCNNGFKYLVFWKSQLFTEAVEEHSGALGNAENLYFGTEQEAVSFAMNTVFTPEFRALIAAANATANEKKNELGHATFFPMPS